MWRCALALSLVSAGGVGSCQPKKPTPAPAAEGSSQLPAAASRHPSSTPSVAGPVDAGLHSEGRLTLRLKQGGEAELAYFAGGTKSRVGVKRVPGGGQNIAAIVDWSGDKLWLLLENQRAYAEMDLAELRQVALRLGRWQSKRTGQTEQVGGTSCQLWELTDGSYRVSACLAQGPLRADPATVEKAVKLELPDWAKRILTEGQMPLRVTVKGPGGQILWDQRVDEWSFGPVASGDFEVPTGYHQVAWQQRAAPPAASRRSRPGRPRSDR